MARPSFLDWLWSHFKRSPPGQEPRAVLRFDSDGLTLDDSGRVCSFRWADVCEVVTFKEDLFAYDEICLGFRLSGTDSYVVVRESSVNFAGLFTQLPQVFPGLQADWYQDVMLPAFAENWTTIWGEPPAAP